MPAPILPIPMNPTRRGVSPGTRSFISAGIMVYCNRKARREISRDFTVVRGGPGREPALLGSAVRRPGEPVPAGRLRIGGVGAGSLAGGVGWQAYARKDGRYGRSSHPHILGNSQPGIIRRGPADPG